MDELTETETAMLAFERHWWKFAGAKETAIWERFGINATRYYQCLNGLIDSPAALRADPMLVHRLQRLRDQRRRQRDARRLGFQPGSAYSSMANKMANPESE